MEDRRISLILFHDKESKRVILQDRRRMNKWGEEYGFFGGQIEEGETPEEALKREVLEELGIQINNFELFEHRIQELGKIGIRVEKWVHLAKFPDLNNLNVQEGELEILNFDEALKKSLVPGDNVVLEKIINHLKK